MLVVRANKTCQLRPLAISSAVCEKHCGQSQGVHHGNEPAPLLEPVLAGATQAGTIVQHSVAEDLSLTSHHVSQFIKRETGIFWVLVDKDPASLQGTPPHLSVQWNRGCLANWPSPYLMRCLK